VRLGTESEIALWFALQQLDAALRLFNDSHTDDRCLADLKKAREAVMVACREHLQIQPVAPEKPRKRIRFL
jgi:hypothetical protein